MTTSDLTAAPAGLPDPVGQWFRGAGLGLFIHWDHASQQGLEVSWPMVGGIEQLGWTQHVPVEQYHSSATTFDPTNWDPKGLAQRAVAVGARYAVMTTKHHSGYAMWPTEVAPERSIAASPYAGDLVGEYVEAMSGAGLRVGLYLSLPDWGHPDYPAVTDADAPYRLGQSPQPPVPGRWEAFVDDLFAQVTELLTWYGRIDLLWFDGAWERSPDQWRAAELQEHIRSLQPDIIINDRLPDAGNYATPEQHVPTQSPDGAWETCLTMNRSWGYVPGDTRYKSPRQLVHTLAEVVAKGGNLLLNVSPRGDGSLPPEQVERLDVLASWNERHAEAVHDVEPGLEPWHFYGPSTRRGDTIYAICVSRPYEAVVVRGLPVRRVRSTRLVSTGEELAHTVEAGVMESFLPDPTGTVRIAVDEPDLDPVATVVAIEIEPA